MTRPRMSGRAVSCSVEFAVMKKTIEATPSGHRDTTATSRVGASATSIVTIPTTTAAIASGRSPARPRPAITSAPASEPTPVTARNRPNVPASPSNVRRANSGISTV